MSTTQKGKEGEKMAAAYLAANGYDILEMNYRYKRGEVDIIALKERLLVFVEVKMKKKIDFGFPEDSVDAKKEEMIITTADNYIYKTDWQGPIRFDIISIWENKGKPETMHFQDAFY